MDVESVAFLFVIVEEDGKSGSSKALEADFLATSRLF